ncbi:zinc ribbon domain-containing protein, partial [Candidatus Bathyarchaeota archaeon]|nr:zinc ribbon domain-containing protein [Candidatus Bathyarchaeota archaeon]
MPYCSKCGSELEKGAKFCFKCGMTTMMSQDPTVNRSMRKNKNKPTSPLIIAVIAIVVIVVVIGLISAVVFLGGFSPSGT